MRKTERKWYVYNKSTNAPVTALFCGSREVRLFTKEEAAEYCRLKPEHGYEPISKLEGGCNG